MKNVLLAIFALSGFSGLIYESIWSHYLKLFLGHAAYAQTLVLAIFMGGMALGSWISARYSNQFRNLLLGYMVIEGFIGILGLVFHSVFVALTDWYLDTLIPRIGAGVAVQFLKWIFAALLITPQSVLLGMTFPLMSCGIIRRFPTRPGHVLAMLYFTNSLGAAVGVLISGFVLIAKVGLPGTIMTAGLLNVLLAMTVWFLIRGQKEPAPVARTASDPASMLQGPWFIVSAALLSGGASFLYEIGWIRMLSLVLGSSTHAFELMLSAFIIGLAFGGLWIRKRIDALVEEKRFLGQAMVATGLFALLTLLLYSESFDLMAQAMLALAPTANGYVGFNVFSHGLAALMMVPATFFAGMTLPLMTHVLLRDGYGERAVGSVYAANTVGAIGGVIIAVHVLMPMVGVKGLIIAGAAIHLLMGWMCLHKWQTGTRQVHQVRLIAVGCLASITWASLFIHLDPLRMSAGVYRFGTATLPEGSTVLFHRDGKTATVSLTAINGHVSIRTNGKADAALNMGDGPANIDEVTMVMAGALPLAIHPAPKRVANIGIGSGLTSHVLLTSPNVEKLDTVEIEPYMAVAARQGFMPRVRNTFSDPRSRIIFEDAKTFFAASDNRYDVIVSEPSNPWVSGVSTLFSEEFYQRITRYLEPNGLFVQWLQTYETDISVVASVLKALSPHFEDYRVYLTDIGNILVVATPFGPLPQPNWRIFELPELARELNRAGIASFQDIENRLLGSKRLLGPVFESYRVPVNSDYFPYVDLVASRARFLKQSAAELAALTWLPIPVLELLDPDRRLHEQTIVNQTSAYIRDQLVSQAMNLREAMLRRDMRKLPPAAVQNVISLNLTAAECRDEGNRQTWLYSVYDLSRQTSALLTPIELAAIWQRIGASACMASLSEAERKWVGLLAAVAGRDMKAIATLGRELLDAEPNHLNGEHLAYALVAAVSAELANSNKAAAQSLWTLRNSAFDVPPEFSLALRWLHVLSLNTELPEHRNGNVVSR